jgi:hypothetical protein
VLVGYGKEENTGWGRRGKWGDAMDGEKRRGREGKKNSRNGVGGKKCIISDTVNCYASNGFCSKEKQQQQQQEQHGHEIRLKIVRMMMSHSHSHTHRPVPVGAAATVADPISIYVPISIPVPVSRVLLYEAIVIASAAIRHSLLES